MYACVCMHVNIFILCGMCICMYVWIRRKTHPFRFFVGFFTSFQHILHDLARLILPRAIHVVPSQLLARFLNDSEFLVYVCNELVASTVVVPDTVHTSGSLKMSSMKGVFNVCVYVCMYVCIYVCMCVLRKEKLVRCHTIKGMYVCMYVCMYV